ncbi:MAG: carbohydrate ABC transporter permease [Eubacteriales bacterium]|nr:carbohydrate ABC transporter permease [Eubacteriales bacterium]
MNLSLTRRRRSKRRGAVNALLITLVKILVALILFFPIIWIASSSLKTLVEVSQFPPRLLPAQPQWSNYTRILEDVSFFRYLSNTLLLILGCTSGTLISSSLVAYPLARMEFPGKKLFFSLIIATMLVPGISLIIPQYLMFNQFGWLDTLLPMIVPSFFAYPYNVFLFRQFFRSIPKELDEAASIDGCNRVGIFFKVLVPLSKPTFATIGVLSAVFWWNELTQPIIYLTQDTWRPLTVAMMVRYTHFGDFPFATTWHTLMAASALMILPPMLLYLFGSKFLIQGIKTSGMKG